MKNLFLLLLLSACTAGAPDPVFTPVPVDMPQIVKCKMPDVTPVPDLMKTLPPTAGLADFTKACTQQILQDKAALTEWQAAMTACVKPQD